MASERDLQRAKQAATNAVNKNDVGNIARSILPSTGPSSSQVEIEDSFPYPTALRFAFLGTGQGGSRIANTFWNLGYRRVGAFNTTDSDFHGLDDAMPKFSLDIGGAKKDARLAEESLNGREEDIWDLFTRSWGTDVDCGIICASLGGGTGSGTVAKLIELGRKYLQTKHPERPARVGAIISLPGLFEGQQQARNAVNAFRKLLEIQASPILIVDNARISELYKPSMLKLYGKANETVAQLLHLFNRLAKIHSEHTSFDESELTQLLDSGIVVLSGVDIPVETIKNPADVSTLIRDKLTHNVLAAVDLKKGKKAACLFVGTEAVLDRFQPPYFEAGFQQLGRIVGSAYPDVETVLHTGVYTNTEEGLQCYTMVGDLEPPMERLAGLAKTAGIREATSSLAAFFRLQ